jgi:hypothetical protein
MITVITLIELKSPFKYFQLVVHYLKIMKQAKASNCLQLKSTGLWTTYYTLTQWKTVEEMKSFARSGNHLMAMKQSASIAKEIRTLTFESIKTMRWKEVKIKVKEEGKLVIYK